MKDNLLNTFNPSITLVVCILAIVGSLTWANKSTVKPFLPPKPLLKINKFL